MKTLSTTIPFFLITLCSFGQSDPVHHKVYFATIEHKTGLIAKSILYDVSDSSVYLTDKTGKFSDSVSYKDIEKIKIRRKGSVGTGIALGVSSGVIVGAVVGGATYQPPEQTNAWFTYDPGPGANIAAGAFLIGILGLPVGAILGSIPTKSFKVHHDYKQFSSSVPEIKKYCLHR